MSEDESKQDQTRDKSEETANRSKREHRREDNEDGEERSESKSREDSQTAGSDPLNVDRESAGKSEEQLDVPQVTLEQVSLPNASERDTETLTTDQSVQVPQIHIQSTRSDSKELVETVQIGAEDFKTDIPQFKLDAKQSVKSVELNGDVLEGIERVQRVQIPQVRLGVSNRIRPFSTFLETVPELDNSKTEVEVEAVAEKSVEENETVTAQKVNEESSGVLNNERDGSWAEDELPDPLELLFGSKGADIRSDNPMIVLVKEDALIGAIETLVKRRYREIEGGEPNPLKFDTADRLTDEERWISAGGQIFTAQLNEEEWEKLEEEEYQEDWQSILSNRIDQLFSGQEFGAIIFNCIQLPNPEIISAPYHPPRKIEIEGRVNWRRIAEIFWTGLDRADPRGARTFSQVFGWKGNGIAQDRREHVLNALDGKFALATEDDESASDEHYYLKVFVVKWLVEQLWESGDEFAAYDSLVNVEYMEIEERIQTEHTLQAGEEDLIRPDIRYGSQVFEVEMFFGEADGSGIISKLQATVRKYENVEPQINEINIVVDNLTCLLHLEDLARFKRAHKEWEENHMNINLYTVDLEDQELKPIMSIANDMNWP